MFYFLSSLFQMYHSGAYENQGSSINRGDNWFYEYWYDEK